MTCRSASYGSPVCFHDFVICNLQTKPVGCPGCNCALPAQPSARWKGEYERQPTKISSTSIEWAISEMETVILLLRLPPGAFQSFQRLYATSTFVVGGETKMHPKTWNRSQRPVVQIIYYTFTTKSYIYYAFPIKLFISKFRIHLLLSNQSWRLQSLFRLSLLSFLQHLLKVLALLAQLPLAQHLLFT